MILTKCVALLIQCMVTKKVCLLIQYDRARKIIIEVTEFQDADFNFWIYSENYFSL